MEWLGVIAAFGIGWLLRRAWSKDMAARQQTEQQRRIEAEGRYLEALRRELGVWLISENPSAFRDVYGAARAYDREVRKGDKHRAMADRASLSTKYPFFSDFDLVGLKHFVPFRAEYVSEFDIVQRYLDISKFLTLLSIEHPHSKIYPFSENDDEVIERVIRETQDGNLRRHIDTAMGRYYAFRQNSPVSDEDKFSDREYEVTRRDEPYLPEIRYGILIKADGRCCIYSFFVGDEKTYYHYAETDEHFKRSRALSPR